MLVLSRKQTESIVINDNIVVTILSVRGNTVRLGVEAPREVPVLRSELDRRQTIGVPSEIGVVAQASRRGLVSDVAGIRGRCAWL